MKKIKFFIGLFLAVLMFPAIFAAAETNTYTVIIRAGNVGVFSVEQIPAADNIEVTKNYMKIKVEKGSCLKDAVKNVMQWNDNTAVNEWFRAKIIPEKNYVLKDLFDVNGENKAIAKVEKNMEYVLDYERQAGASLTEVSSTKEESHLTSAQNTARKADIMLIEQQLKSDSNVSLSVLIFIMAGGIIIFSLHLKKKR